MERKASLHRDKRRARRWIVVAALGTLPAALLAWSGCSSSDSSSSGRSIVVDPGGTYGAEITVTVVGRGHVSTDIPGLDCPSDCFARFVFKSPSDNGASAGLKLKAVTNAPNTRFGGWKFETTSLGTRGKGPENCNPVKRDTATPSVDTNAAEITLPYGETNGQAPPGQDCGGFTTVPVAYNLTATFIDTTLVDGGPDGDGGAGEVLYQTAGGAAREIGVVGSRLYWKFESGALAGIATGSTLTTPNAIPQTLVPATQSINRFEVDTHLVVQKQSGELSVYANGGTVPMVLPGAPLSCDAVTSDPSYVYCQAGDTLYQWTIGGTGPTTLYTGLPTGADRFASDNVSYLYFVDNSLGQGSSVIKRTPSRIATDGGAPTFTDLVGSQTNPIRLRVSTSRMWWINYEGSAIVGEGRTASTGSSFSNVVVPATSGLRFLATDPSTTSTAWFGIVPVGMATNSQIVRAGTSTASSSTFRSGINGLGGVAADTSYVYWTAQDGRVYRAPKL